MLKPLFYSVFDKQCYKKTNLEQIIAPRKAKLGPDNSPIYIYILCHSCHIYICCRVKNWSKICLFGVKSWSKFFVFENLFLPAERKGLFKQSPKQKIPKSCVKNWSTVVAQHAWTGFKHNLGPVFNTTFFVFCFLAETQFL